MSVRSLRGKGALGRRSRTQALPFASASFFAIVLCLSVWHNVREVPRKGFSVDNSLLDIAAVRSGSSYGDLCSSGNIFSKKASLAFLIPGVIITFVGLAIVTDDYFVAALERICERLQLSEDVAGATFMAAGSSTPEFFASLLAVFVTKDEVGIGTIVGSAVFNILVIIGLSAALAGTTLKLDWRPLFRDSAFYILSIVMLLLFVLGPSKGFIDWWEGLLLVAAYVGYVLFMAFGNKPYMKWAALLGKRLSTQDVDLEAAMPGNKDEPEAVASNDGWAQDGTPVRVKSRYADLNPRTRLRAAQYAIIATNAFASATSESSGDGNNDREPRTFLGVELPTSIVGWLFFPVSFLWRLVFSITIVDCSLEKNAKWWFLTFILSIAWISGISYVMVEAARISGCLLNIPAPAMGLTVLAAGTSVPDALASVSVARGGAGDMAVSNAIGSNVFDILLGLGLPWFLGAAINERIEIPAEPLSVVVIPIVILFAIIITLIALMVLLRWKLRPALGYILFAIYGVFVAYTLLEVYVFKFGGDN